MNGDNGGSSVPDLQAILATLAQYAPPTAAGLPAPTPAVSTPTAPIDPATLQYAATPPAETAKDPRLGPQTRSANASPKPMIDPATITVWPEALRCVTKIAAQNAQFATSIKRMMQEQRDHEMRWYTERQNLKATQASRSASAAKAQSILKSLNTGFYQAPPELDSSETKRETELIEFDRRVYAAQLAMETALTAELKALGVPFFGTDANLLLPAGPELAKQQGHEDRAKHSPLVTEGQLLELRRRMVGHLEDMYRD